MTEKISQDEIDSFQQKIGNGENNINNIASFRDRRKVKKYNFRRPDKFSKDQIRTMQMMHETFARLLTVTLSAQLRALASVHVTSVDQLTYEEFIRSIPNPATLAIFNMDPLRGSAVIEIDPAITYSCINKLFGGIGESPIIMRELSDIEISVMEGIIVRMLGCLRESWYNLIGLRPRLLNIETNPQFALILPHNEMVVLISLEAKVEAVEGMINLCIPYMALEPLIPKLSAQYLFSAIRNDDRVEINNIKNLKVDAEVYFETADLSLRDLQYLKKGKLIHLPEYDSGICYLNAGDSTIYKFNEKRDKKHKPIKPLHYDVIEQKESFLKENFNYGEQVVQKQEDELVPKLKSILNNFESAVNAKFIGHEKKAEKLTELPPENANSSKPYMERVTDLYHKAPDVPDVKNSLIKVRPFDFLEKTDPEILLNFIQNEHTQTIALILSFLETNKAGLILNRLPDGLKADVTRRIAMIQPTTPDVLREVERVLERKLSTFVTEDYKTAGGIEVVTEILSLVDRNNYKIIIDALDRENPELSKEIKARMFIFDDISAIDDDSIKKIIEKINKDDLMIALKGAEEATREVFFRNMSENDAAEFKENMTNLGPKRLRDVEEAQQKIVNIIRKMEDSGEIIVMHEEETI